MEAKQTNPVDFGKRSGLKAHRVSTGAMRLPEDVDEAVELMRKAIDAGMIYIDTSRGYSDSEIKVGKSLKDGYREKVILSTKWSPWVIKVEQDDDASADCTYKRIIESMERLDVEYLDFYQIWSINNEDTFNQATKKGGMLDGIIRAMDEGLIKHTGFTTHDSPENLSKYIEQVDWCEAILCTYSMLNTTYKDVIARAHQKGIATVVMNPTGGGMFADKSAVLKQAVKDAVGIDNVVEAAHRYLSGDENIDTILCGIKKPSDVASTVANFARPPLTAEQRGALEAAMAGLSKKNVGFCTACKYCLPCPEGINIPELLNIIYMARILKVPNFAKECYHWQLSEDNTERSAHPAECTQCSQCGQKCTQKLHIIEELKDLAKDDFF